MSVAGRGGTVGAGAISFLELRTSAVLSSIRVLNELLEVALAALGVDEASRHDLALGVAELVANVCEHEYGLAAAGAAAGEVVVRIERQPGTLALTVVSQGPRFDFEAALRRACAHDPLADLDASGLGLPLLVGLFDQVAHDWEQTRGNRITLTKRQG